MWFESSYDMVSCPGAAFSPLVSQSALCKVVFFLRSLQQAKGKRIVPRHLSSLGVVLVSGPVSTGPLR